MTKKSLATTLVIASTLIISPVKAGFLDKLSDRVKNQVENVIGGKIAKKAGEEAGEATDAVINPESNDPDSEQSSNSNERDIKANSSKSASSSVSDMGGLGGMLQALQQKVNIEDQYTFMLTVEMEIVSEGDANKMEQSFSNDAFHVKIDENQSMILDIKNESMIMIDKKAKTKASMSSQIIKKMAKMGGANLNGKVNQPQSIQRLKRTGETKKILGYTSNEWAYTEGRDKGEIWVTEEINFNFVDFNKRLISLFDNGGGQFSVDFSNLKGQIPIGLPLESTNYVNGKIDSQMKMVSVSEKKHVIDLSDYREQSMLNQ